MQTLIDHNIVPRIYPSRRAQRLGLGGLGIMHNKFMVIDNKVITGSANFTDATMRLRNIHLNYENVLLLHKPAIAWKYREQFYEIQKAIFNMYIGLIRNSEPDRLPIWLRRLAPVLYDMDRSFKAFVNTRLPRFTQEQQDRLMNLLNPPRQRVLHNRITRGQERFDPIGSRPEQNR